MPRISLGVLCGLIFGSLDTALMIPLSFPDKRAAMLGAFIARFALGFVICNIKLPWPGWVAGLFLGVLLSPPDAIITKLWPQFSRQVRLEVWLSVGLLVDLVTKSNTRGPFRSLLEFLKEIFEWEFAKTANWTGS